MTVHEIISDLKGYQRKGLSLFTTSSFQTHSLVLLHIISRVKLNIPVYFINTGYLFPETIQFKDRVAEKFGLDVISIQSETPKSLQLDAQGRLLFTSDPDYCCQLNKTQPLQQILRQYDVWINGVRADQSRERSMMKKEQRAPFDTIRFHPVLHWNAKMVYDYIREYDLPRHPLEHSGYQSIGCEPCTRKLDPEMVEREARWYGMNKTECGLHTELITR
jgi:phosphoadenosine phosphosulfate reductase